MEWLLKDDAGSDKKHTEVWHPLAAFTVTTAAGVGAGLCLAGQEALRGEDKAAAGYTIMFQRVGLLLAGYIVLVFTIRSLTKTGVRVWYDLCWACNQAMVVGAIGAILGCVELVAAACIMVSLDQSMWWVDLPIWFVKGTWPVGVAKYLSKPECSWIEKVTAGHHMWFIPLLLWLLSHVEREVDWLWAFVVSQTITSILLLATRALIPFKLRGKAWKKGVNSSEEGAYYMNVNLAYECWRDVKVPWLHTADHSSWYLTLVFHSAHWALLNAPFTLVFKWLV